MTCPPEKGSRYKTFQVLDSRQVNGMFFRGAGSKYSAVATREGE
jgi:hypothetical protein